MAAVQLGRIWGNMARGIATVSANPAGKVGLEDRGVLQVGKRADLIRFATMEDFPVLKETWSEGRRVF